MRKLLSNRAVVGAIVCAPMAIMYIMGLQRSVWTGDSAEFVTAAYTLGVPHPTGYPIYVWLGKLFSFMPIGGAALRLNVMSMVFAVAALYVTFQIVAREVERLSGSIFLAYTGGLLAVVLLGHARPFWERAEVAEVYSLSAFMMVLFVYAFFRWLDGGAVRVLLLASLIYGLGLGAHLSNGLLLPALFIIVLVTTRTLRPVGQAALLIGVGLTQYVFVLARSALAAPYIHPDAWFFNHNIPTGIAGPVYNWLWYITGGRWHGETTHSFAAAEAKAGRLLDAVLADFGPVGICLLVLGLLVCILHSRPRGKAGLLLGIVVCGFLYFASYRPAAEAMVLPFFAALAVLGGIGLGGVGVILKRVFRSVRPARPVSYAAVIALAALVVGTCIARPGVNYSRRNGPAILIARMIEDLPEGSTVDGLKWKYEKIVEYYEVVEGAHVPFTTGQCDLNRICDGTCYALDTVKERYERMGFRLELKAEIEGAPRLYLLRPPAR